MGTTNSLQKNSDLAHTLWSVLVCGAGPVGLLCAQMLGRAGIRTLVVERLDKPVEWSRAIGISPPSLEIFSSLGLADELLSAGSPIRDVVVHGGGGYNSVLGKVSFSDIPSPWPFMLSVPQIQTEAILNRTLADYKSVHVLRGYEITDISESSSRIKATLSCSDPDQPTMEVSADWVLGCDGMKSAIRSLAKIPFRGRRYHDTFVMGDFIDTSYYGTKEGFGKKAHLFFTPNGAIESFPLPNGKRRWIVQTPTYVSDPGLHTIVEAVRQRTGIELSNTHLLWQSPFGVQRFIASNFKKRKYILLGDAAHIMSPIGGQGMNTGFADAAQLIPHLIDALHGNNQNSAFQKWERQRRRAFNVAASRAWRSMKLGTIRGKLASLVRNSVLWIMLNGPGKSRLPLDYAMLTIPHHSGKKKES